MFNRPRPISFRSYSRSTGRVTFPRGELRGIVGTGLLHVGCSFCCPIRNVHDEKIFLLAISSTMCFANKYKRYYGPRRQPVAYLLYYMPMVSPPVHKYSSVRSTAQCAAAGRFDARCATCAAPAVY